MARRYKVDMADTQKNVYRVSIRDAWNEDLGVVDRVLVEAVSESAAKTKVTRDLEEQFYVAGVELVK